MASPVLPSPHKRLAWVGRSHEELLEFPELVRRSVGYALRFAQAGEKHGHAKPLKGYGGAGVLEVVENSDGETYRAVYTVKFADFVYVLLCFQKKAKRGIETPKSVLELIRQRLRLAQQIADQIPPTESES